MVKGPVVTAIVACVAMAGVVGAFMSGGSRYVTIQEAKELGGDSLHLAGVLDKKNCGTDPKTMHLVFKMKDAKGEVCTVEHIGAVPSSLMDADKVVAVGAFHEGRFVSRELLVKCPSKYEEKGKTPLANPS